MQNFMHFHVLYEILGTYALLLQIAGAEFLLKESVH